MSHIYSYLSQLQILLKPLTGDYKLMLVWVDMSMPGDLCILDLLALEETVTMPELLQNSGRLLSDGFELFVE